MVAGCHCTSTEPELVMKVSAGAVHVAKILPVVTPISLTNAMPAPLAKVRPVGSTVWNASLIVGLAVMSKFSRQTGLVLWKNRGLIKDSPRFR